MTDKSTLRYSLLGIGLLIFMAGMVWGTSQLHDTLIKGRLEQVAKDWEKIRIGTLVYGVDFCGMYFPSDTQRQWKKNPKTPLTFGTLDQTTSYSGHSVSWYGLTTPVAYIKKEPLYDPFRDGEQMYGYTCWTLHHQGGDFFVLQSPGPDKVSQFSLGQFRKWMEPYQKARTTLNGTSGMLTETEKAMLRDYVTPYCYDPSNGLASKGDLIQIMGYDGNSDTTHIFGFGYKNWYQYPSLKNPSQYELATAGRPLDYHWGYRTRQLIEDMPQPKTIQLPSWFIQQMESAGINLNPSKEEAVKQNLRLKKISQAYLGTLYKALEEGRTLTPEETKKFQDIKKLDPAWWNSINKPIITWKGYQTQSYNKNDVIIPFTLYLESQVLLMGEASAKRDDKTLQETPYRYFNLFSYFTEHNNYYFHYDSLHNKIRNITYFRHRKSPENTDKNTHQ